MLFSVCITYYYKRNNIEDLLFELNKYKLNDLEIIIRNDNTINWNLKIICEG